MAAINFRSQPPASTQHFHQVFQRPRDPQGPRARVPPAPQVDFKEYVRWCQGASWSEQLLVRDDRDREARRLARVYGIHLLEPRLGRKGVRVGWG